MGDGTYRVREFLQEGDTILVASIYDDTGAIDAGVVHVYDRDTGRLLRTWANPAPVEQDQFGSTISVMGDNVLVSTKNSAYRGNAVYLLDGTTGDVLQTFTKPAGVADRYFGEAVAAWGNTVIVGAPGGDGRYDGGSLRGGAVFLFDAATGELLRTIESPEPDRYDDFGGSLAVVGDSMLVGASGDDPTVEDSGSAYLFDVSTGELIGTFTDPDPVMGGKLGQSIVAADGGTIVIAPHSATGGPLMTQAYVYDADTFDSQTDADGNYRFEGVKPGDYRVREVVEDGYALSMPEGKGTYEITVISGLVEDNFDFGNYSVEENGAPEAIVDHYTLYEGTALVVDVAGVPDDDTDPDDDPPLVIGDGAEPAEDPDLDGDPPLVTT